MAESKSARTHLTILLVLQVILLVVHLLIGIATVVNASLFFYGDAGWGPYADDAFDQGRRVGNIIALLASGSWAAVGLVWTPLNAYGLWKRRAWARSSTSAYWMLSLLTLCWAPFAIYGLIALGRHDVREALANDE